MSKKSKSFELFDQGLRPSSPEVKALGLASKTAYNYFQLWKHSTGATVVQNEGAEPADTHGSHLSTAIDMTHATIIKFERRVISCSLTPIMMLGKQLAYIKYNWPEDMPWEDFLDTIIKSFFQDRGIHLLPYYDEDEAESEE